MKKEIHVWDLIKMNKQIVVDINKSLKIKIKRKVNETIPKIAKELNLPPSRIYEYFLWEKSFIPIKILFKISDKFSIQKEEVEKSIIAYKQLNAPSKNSIKNPIFPIIISPYLTSMVANLFFDGSMPKDGKGIYYNQKDEKIMNDFIKKTKNVFGDVSYSLKLDHRGVLKLRIPRIIGEICKYIYQINSFGCFDSKIPEKIFNLNKEHKVSFILTGILDEGSIAYDGSIQFGVSNKNMMEDFKKLCEIIGLKTTEIKGNSLGHFHLYIKSLEKFYKIYNELSIKYPLISLRYKEDRLKKSLEIKKQEFFYTKRFADKRKELILIELDKKENSINYLSDKFIIPPRTIRRYMYKLMKENKILRKKIRSEYIYFVPH